jgi:transglutaminase-like putative cysteine protease
MRRMSRKVIARGLLPAGPAGTRATVALMKRISMVGARDPYVRATAIEIIKRKRIPANDHLGEMKALFEAVRDGIRYTRDPINIELLQTPRQTLKDRVGDCDDKSTLLASMLTSIGHPAALQYRVIGTKPGAGYSHVYVVAKLNGKEIAMDPTPTTAALGWQYPTPTMTKDFAL